MSKERRGVSLDPEVNDYLSREGVNASEKINQLVKQEMNAGTTEQAMLKLRLEQVRGEITNHEGELERLKQQEQDLLDRLDTLQEEQKQEKNQTLESVVEKFELVYLSSRDEPMVDANDEELQPHADELDMTVDELRTEIKEAN